MASNFHGWHTHWPVFSDKLVCPEGGIGSNYHYSDGGFLFEKGEQPRRNFFQSCSGLAYKKPGEFSQKIPVASFVDCFLNPGKVIDFNGKKLSILKSKW